MAQVGKLRGVHGYATESGPRDGTVARENAGYIAPGQSARKFQGTITLTAAAQTIPLGTVPNGRTWVLTDFYFSHNDTVALEFDLQIANAGGTVVINIFAAPVKGDTAPVQQAGQETQPNVPSGAVVQLKLAADLGKLAYFNMAFIDQAIGAG